MNTYDVVVLGAGSGGYAAAFRAAQHGLSVALIEQDKVGGTCLHRGCIPTKALLHAAESADAIAHASTIGIKATLNSIDIGAVHAYKNNVVDRLHKGLQGLVRANRVELITGVGRYVGGTTVDVDGQQISGTSLILATGSQVKSLPGIEISGRVMTSDEVLHWEELPKRVIVLGGGVIGVEFASVWSSLGAEVTLIEALPRLVPNEDEWASKLLARAFKKRGITVHTATQVTNITQDATSVTVTTDSELTLEADALLVAVGRGPRTTGTGFADNGVTLDQRGFVEVDEQLRTTIPNVYAVGDIVAGPQLAHRGFQHGLYVADVIAGVEARRPCDENIPKVSYCTPEIASVGLSESQARERFGDIDTVTYDLAGNGKSQILATTGGVKLIRQRGGPVVGIHMVGARVGELIGEAQLIVNWGAHPDEVADLIHAHPSQTEALGEAHLALAGKPLHAHG